MRLFFLITTLLMSVAEISMSQSTGSRLTQPGARRKFVGISHIEVDLGQRNTLLIGFDQYAQVQAHKNIDSVLRLFVADYRKVEDTTQSPTRATHALYRLGNTDRDLALRYVPQPTTSFRFRDADEPVQVKTQQDTLQIAWVSALAKAVPTDFAVYFFVNSLQDLERLLSKGGINSKVEQALESVRDFKHHNLTNPRYTFDLLQSVDNKPTFQTPGLAGEPFLSFHPGIGVGLIRTQWIPSLNFDLELIPNQFRRVGYTIGYTGNFFFGQSNTDITVRDFLNVGVSFYRYNKDRRTVAFSRQIASFYVGIPLRRNEYFFEPNTIRLGGTVYHNGLFKVQPELYMSNFKNVYPALRLVVGL
ncbi:hypothetical protein [Spirosoma validum]|uniref:Uncharacterized protein n=1 Tax=Spirosoma validum TaxID=2771355 RepID=A0A927B680_9BACT|nr:hypothetical protein [Spirosoma validum]MBD2756426.1 hypothetical protein [Spirosoma validum]